MAGRKPEQATLIDVLVDGFEKNEVIHGYHWRKLPLPDEAAAARKFAAFVEEATRWKGTPSHLEDNGPRRIAEWDDLEIRQAGAGILVRVSTAGFISWWHDKQTWHGKPLDPVWDWLDEDRRRQ